MAFKLKLKDSLGGSPKNDTPACLWEALVGFLNAEQREAKHVLALCRHPSALASPRVVWLLPCLVDKFGVDKGAEYIRCRSAQ